MADTQRSISALLTTLFQDGQTAGAITPQDVRDLIVSLQSARGSVTLASNATQTAISVSGTFVPVVGTFVAGGSPNFMTETTGGRLTYTGTSTRFFMIEASFSMTAALNNKLIGVGIAKNGVLINSGINRAVSTGTDEGAGAVVAYTEMATNDYIELYATNKTDTSNLTVTNAQLNAMGNI